MALGITSAGVDTGGGTFAIATWGAGGGGFGGVK